jgi:hypothetical protein
MSFVRPEATAILTRWREALIGAVALLIGLWWIAGPGRLLTIPGVGLVVLGVALVWVGIQRGRFRGPGGGAGQVQIDEGQITYFGPLTGGLIALREMTRVTLLKSTHPDHWQLEQNGQPPLLIPVNALGADGLFDAFATLPGLRTEHMLSALQATGGHEVLIWEREPSFSAQLPLH